MVNVGVLQLLLLYVLFITSNELEEFKSKVTKIYRWQKLWEIAIMKKNNSWTQADFLQDTK